MLIQFIHISLINIVPLGQCMKKLRRILPFPFFEPLDITVHPVVSYDFLRSSNLVLISPFIPEGLALMPRGFIP
jgi:hypothetical protein